jgi:hypothetical protein
MNKIFISICLVCTLFIWSSCTDDFEDMNTSSNAIGEVVDPAYFFVEITEAVYANYQRNVNLYPDLYSQYFANTEKTFNSPRYEYVDGWIGNQWKEFYTQHLRRSFAIDREFKDKEAYTDALAINEILICYWWSRMTDTYGDIPYSGAGEQESVPYSPQKEVYLDLLDRLKAAASAITGNQDQYNYGEYDLIYQGDAGKWKRFANSLRLRLAMRLSDVAPETSKKVVIESVEAGLMQSNSDAAKVPMSKTDYYDYLHQMAWNWDNIRVSKTFTNYLYNQSTVGEDPRASLLLTYKRKNEEDKSVALSRQDLGLATYEGLENGYQANMPEDRLDRATINLQGGYIDFTGEGNNQMYCPIMFYSETLFLKAEAALRGWISDNAGDLYKEAIQASMDYVGVSSSDAQVYINGLSELSGSNEAQLKQIITQKWIANFPNGVESWADFRRTDYPDLTLPTDGVSSSASVAQETYVKRIRYPDNQHLVNEVSMPESLNTVDADRMDVKVWWDVKGTEEKGVDGLMNSNF